jgi:hypothetical protein
LDSSQLLPGDWQCEVCHFLNFAKNEVCISATCQGKGKGHRPQEAEARRETPIGMGKGKALGKGEGKGGAPGKGLHKYREPPITAAEAYHRYNAPMAQYLHDQRFGNSNGELAAEEYLKGGPYGKGRAKGKKGHYPATPRNPSSGVVRTAGTRDLYTEDAYESRWAEYSKWDEEDGRIDRGVAGDLLKGAPFA